MCVGLFGDGVCRLTEAVGVMDVVVHLYAALVFADVYPYLAWRCATWFVLCLSH